MDVARPNAGFASGSLVFPLIGAYGRAVHPDDPRRDAPEAGRHRKTSGPVAVCNADVLAALDGDAAVAFSPAAAGMLGGADDLNAAHMAGVLRLPLPT